jgi:hypothetical protein
VLGLPAAQFIMGYFVNADLYEAANLDAPEYGFTVEEWRDAVTELNDINRGVLGLDEMEFVTGWYPNTVDPEPDVVQLRRRTDELQLGCLQGCHCRHRRDAALHLAGPDG